MNEGQDINTHSPFLKDHKIQELNSPDNHNSHHDNHHHKKHGIFNIGHWFKHKKHEDVHYSKSPEILNAENWTINDVADWLKSLGYEEYCELFSSYEITGKELLILEFYDLKDLPIQNDHHVKRILHEIKHLRRIIEDKHKGEKSKPKMLDITIF